MKNEEYPDGINRTLASPATIFQPIVGAQAFVCEAEKQPEREVQSSLKAELQHVPNNFPFSIFHFPFSIFHSQFSILNFPFPIPSPGVLSSKTCERIPFG